MSLAIKLPSLPIAQVFTNSNGKVYEQTLRHRSRRALAGRL